MITGRCATRDLATPRKESRTMDAIALLKADHRAVSKLFREYKAAKRQKSATRAKPIDNAIKALSIHAAIEEQVFYPAVREEVPKLEDSILESLEEHHVLKWTLEEIASIGVDDERYDAKVTVMMEQVRHHVEEEETDWFPKVRDALSRARLQELGAQLQKAKRRAPRTPEPDRVVPR
jgi:hemerythrin superfamily protein